jgi:diadenosine tetraphosphate (Ap4A) HIT family hydrolase
MPITYNTMMLPKRSVKKISELNENEMIDLFLFAQKIAQIMEKDVDPIKNEGKLVEIIVRDGFGAGDEQESTCVWLVPRKRGERIIFEEGKPKTTKLDQDSQN